MINDDDSSVAPTICIAGKNTLYIVNIKSYTIFYIFSYKEFKKLSYTVENN